MRIYRVEVSFNVDDSAYRRTRHLFTQAHDVIGAAEKAKTYIETLNPGAREVRVWSVNHIGELSVV